MTVCRYLIVNADDFGMSRGVNAGIIEAHERGILTSASLMVRWPESRAAAHYARSHRNFSVGLHLDLGEWTYTGEEWRQAYEVVALDDQTAITGEVERQLQAFRDLIGSDPTHLDSHQHVHRSEPILSVLKSKARQYGIELRAHSSEVRYCGAFYGQSNKGYPSPQGVSVSAMLEILSRLKPGVTELGCHPGRMGDAAGMYRDERTIECTTLCDPAVRAAIAREGIVLCSFSDWRLKGLSSSLDRSRIPG